MPCPWQSTPRYFPRETKATSRQSRGPVHYSLLYTTHHAPLTTGKPVRSRSKHMKCSPRWYDSGSGTREETKCLRHHPSQPHVQSGPCLGAGVGVHCEALRPLPAQSAHSGDSPSPCDHRALAPDAEHFLDTAVNFLLKGQGSREMPGVVDHSTQFWGQLN